MIKRGPGGAQGEFTATVIMYELSTFEPKLCKHFVLGYCPSSNNLGGFMTIKSLLITTFSGAAGMVLGVAALASPWELNNEQSQLAFVSFKNTHIAELHSFETLQGNVQGDGTFEISIPLDQVQTHIDIRDERMRQYLFETDKYPMARITGSVPAQAMGELAVDQPSELAVKFDIQMHDHSVSQTAQVQAVKLSATRLLVATTQPVILNAKDYGFEPGIERLRELAGLESITLAVPVTVNLVFDLREQ